MVKKNGWSIDRMIDEHVLTAETKRSPDRADNEENYRLSVRCKGEPKHWVC